jgi:O-antigen/teichoic acid export membrane protein
MFRFTAWIWLLAGTGLALAMPTLLPLVYGSQFSPAIWPAIVFIPAAAFAGQASILEESMRAQGRAFIGLEARLAGMVVFLGLGWLLAERLGVLGVTLAYVAAQAVVLTFMLFVARWHFPQSTFANLVPRREDLRELIHRLKTRLQLLAPAAKQT